MRYFQPKLALTWDNKTCTRILLLYTRRHLWIAASVDDGHTVTEHGYTWDAQEMAWSRNRYGVFSGVTQVSNFKPNIQSNSSHEYGTFYSLKAKQWMWNSCIFCDLAVTKQLLFELEQNIYPVTGWPYCCDCSLQPAAPNKTFTLSQGHRFSKPGFYPDAKWPNLIIPNKQTKNTHKNGGEILFAYRANEMSKVVVVPKTVDMTILLA